MGDRAAWGTGARVALLATLALAALIGLASPLAASVQRNGGDDPPSEAAATASVTPTATHASSTQLPKAPVAARLCAAEPSLFGARPGDAQAASSLMAGRLSIRPHAAVDLPQDPTWSEVLVPESNWEVRYHALLWADVLRRQFVATGDQRLLDRYRFLLQDYVTDNAAASAPRSAWTWYDHAAGQRASVLACASSVLGKPDWLVAAMRLHVDRLSDPAGYKGYGNHSLMQNSGLFALGCVLDQASARSLAMDRASVLLDRAVDAQGVSDEGSFAYQWSNYSWWSDFSRKVSACEQPVPSTFSRIALMPDFLSQASMPSGRGVPFGDTPLGTIRPRRISSEAASLTSVYDRGYAFSRSTTEPDDSRTPSSMVSFRFGQSFVSQPHGHMDAGNVEFEAFGVPLLSDSGSYAYGPGPWRAFVKSSAAHNVVTIDGAEYQRERVSPLLSSTSNRHYAMFSADLQVIEGATWRRTVLHSKRGHWILVDDQVTGVGSNLVTQRWNLPDDQQYRIDQGRSVTQTSGTVKIDLRFLAGSPDLKIRTGWAPPEKPRMVGWRSFGYGTIEPSPTLEASARTGTWHGVTLISARGGSAGPGVTVSDVTVSTSGVAATVSSGGLKERVSLLPWRLTTRDLT